MTTTETKTYKRQINIARGPTDPWVDTITDGTLLAQIWPTGDITRSSLQCTGSSLGFYHQQHLSETGGHCDPMTRLHVHMVPIKKRFCNLLAYRFISVTPVNKVRRQCRLKPDGLYVCNDITQNTNHKTQTPNQTKNGFKMS